MEEEKSMIPCICWIPKGKLLIHRGYAKTRPRTNADVDKEMQEMLNDEELKEELAKHQKKHKGELEEMGILR
jgi:hypothetical protein